MTIAQERREFFGPWFLDYECCAGKPYCDGKRQWLRAIEVDLHGGATYICGPVVPA